MQSWWQLSLLVNVLACLAGGVDGALPATNICVPRRHEAMRAPYRHVATSPGSPPELAQACPPHAACAPSIPARRCGPEPGKCVGGVYNAGGPCPVRVEQTYNQAPPLGWQRHAHRTSQPSPASLAGWGLGRAARPPQAGSVAGAKPATDKPQTSGVAGAKPATDKPQTSGVAGAKPSTGRSQFPQAGGVAGVKPAKNHCSLILILTICSPGAVGAGLASGSRSGIACTIS